MVLSGTKSLAWLWIGWFEGLDMGSSIGSSAAYPFITHCPSFFSTFWSYQRILKSRVSKSTVMALSLWQLSQWMLGSTLVFAVCCDLNWPHLSKPSTVRIMNWPRPDSNKTGCQVRAWNGQREDFHFGTHEN